MTDAQLDRRIADNLRCVQQTIAATAKDNPVRLVCVVKYAQEEWIHALLRAGAGELGENLLPQAAERFDRLQQAGFRFTRHLIGPPQSRKVPLIPGHFDLVQSVGRLKIADLLNAEQSPSGGQLDVLLQVNIAREEQKNGFDPDLVPEAAQYILEQCRALRLRGLMAVPPWPDSYPSQAEFEQGTRRCFAQMREHFDTIRRLFPAAVGFDTLSLGMSQDYVWAIEEGATMVRVGSVLFTGLS